MSYHVYPVIKTEPVCQDYCVTINGKAAQTSTARVSAVPHNRRWPGHQRVLSQSEAIQFLSLSTDEPLHFEITPSAPFEEVKIRPRSLGIKPEITADGKILFTLERPAYFTVEAYGRSRALHIFADPTEEYDDLRSENDVIYFGPGEHDAGLIELTNNQTLFIDEGAVVYASVRASDAENIKILGRGILDNSKNREVILFEANTEGNTQAINNAYRRHTVELEYCKNIVIDGITIRDSLVYNIRPVACENIKISHVKIIGCWRYNSDGIDMHNCVGVHIHDCFIRTFDDSICVKGFDFYDKGDVEAATRAAMVHGGRVWDVFKNVLVQRCVIWNDWGKALEIGAETKAEEIHTVTFRDCDIIHLAGYALDCMNVDYADVHDITFRDINIEADEIIPEPKIQESDAELYENKNPRYMPHTICVEVVCHPEYSAGSNRRGKNRNILFKNIHVLGDKQPRLYFAGYDDDHKSENITIENLYLEDKLITELDKENFHIGSYTENIRLIGNDYSQLRKNDVCALNQLEDSDVVRFENPYGQGIRVMFVGNSITLHGIRPKLGWYNECGMAASAPKCDYVHIVENKIKAQHPDAAFCICQVSGWESAYKTGSEHLSLYERAHDFEADIIVLRFAENVSLDGYDSEAFKRELDRLVCYLDGGKGAKKIITTSFWRHPADTDILAYAKEKGIPSVELGDLGDDETMKAIGLFEHNGVANHPGDLGMAAIAKRITDTLISEKYI